MSYCPLQSWADGLVCTLFRCRYKPLSRYDRKVTPDYVRPPSRRRTLGYGPNLTAIVRTRSAWG